MKHLICKMRGHSLVERSKTDIHIKAYECSRCSEKFTTDGYGRFVKYNSYWEKNHAFFQHYLKRKIVS